MSNATSKLKLPSARVTAPEDARKAAGYEGGVPVSAKTCRVSATTEMSVVLVLGLSQAETPKTTAATPTDATICLNFINSGVERCAKEIEAYRLTHETSSDCSLDNPLPPVMLRTTFLRERACRRSATWSPPFGSAMASKRRS